MTCGDGHLELTGLRNETPRDANVPGRRFGAVPPRMGPEH